MVAALVYSLLCAPSFAQPPLSMRPPASPSELHASPRVIVVLGSDSSLGDRVRGQTVDLDARVISRPEAPAGTWSEQVEVARAAASIEQAHLVVWIADMDSPPGETLHSGARAFVAILTSDADRFYARAIGPPSDTSTHADASAVLELAALSVRAALESLDSPNSLGVPLSQLPAAAAPAVSSSNPQETSRESSSPPASVPLPPVRTTTDEGIPAPDELAGSSFTALLGLGVGTNIDGITAVPWPALQIRGGLQWERLRTLLVGELGSRRRSVTAEADLILERHVLLAQAELALASTSRPLVPWLMGGAGAVLHRRSTETRSEVAVGTPTTARWSPLLRAGLGLEYELSGGVSCQWLSLSTGVDVVAGPPVIEFVTLDGATFRRFRVQPWQPYANLAWVMVW